MKHTVSKRTTTTPIAKIITRKQCYNFKAFESSNEFDQSISMYEPINRLLNLKGHLYIVIIYFFQKARIFTKKPIKMSPQKFPGLNTEIILYIK